MFFSFVNQHHLQVLLHSRANKNAVNGNGDNPLSVAAIFGHCSIVSLLIEHQSCAPSPTAVNASALHFVHANEDGYTPLMLAAAAGHVDVVQRILCIRHKNFDVAQHLEHLSDLGQTALALAVDYGHNDVAQLLSRAGGNINVPATIMLWPAIFADVAQSEGAHATSDACDYLQQPVTVSSSGSGAGSGYSYFAGLTLSSPARLQNHRNKSLRILGALVLTNQRMLCETLAVACVRPAFLQAAIPSVPPEISYFLRCAFGATFFV